MSREVVTLGPPKPTMCNWLMVVLILTAVNSICLLTIIVIIALKATPAPQFYEPEITPPLTYTEYLKMYRDGLLPKRDTAVDDPDEGGAKFTGISTELLKRIKLMIMELLDDQSKDYYADDGGPGKRKPSPRFPAPPKSLDEDLEEALQAIKKPLKDVQIYTRPPTPQRESSTEATFTANTEMRAPLVPDCPEARSKLCINWREQQFCALASKFCESLCACDTRA
ncbi:unnamed protein product, partial [Mesorhabditis spiculigera]